MKKDIKSMTLNQIKQEFKLMGIPSFRANQVNSWLNKLVEDFDGMRNIPKDLKCNLSKLYFIPSIEIENKYVSKLDSTVRYLLKLHDGEYIESVLMKYNHGYSICVSTQAGCKMGCEFCATGKCGFVRNLYASEIISQIQTVQKDMNIRISNVVLMGMGEPLDNYDNVIRFLNLVSSPDCLNIGGRHITLSTCGIADKIYDLADKQYSLTLSVSLHSASDEIRNRLMPVNKVYPIDELMKACKYYFDKTGRRISFEYTMIKGVNDDKNAADILSNRVKLIPCHVNLIPVNSVEGSKLFKSNKETLEKFRRTLESNKINVTVRRTLGNDIKASCGQLSGRRKNAKV